MSVRREGFLEDLAETDTVDDVDFDSLLDASSLGAPHVMAALGYVPDPVRRRIREAVGAPCSVSSASAAVPEEPDPADRGGETEEGGRARALVQTDGDLPAPPATAEAERTLLLNGVQEASHLVLHGPAGVGKSTFMALLALELMSRTVHDAGRMLLISTSQSIRSVVSRTADPTVTVGPPGERGALAEHLLRRGVQTTLAGRIGSGELATPNGPVRGGRPLVIRGFGVPIAFDDEFPELQDADRYAFFHSALAEYVGLRADTDPRRPAGGGCGIGVLMAMRSARSADDALDRRVRELLNAADGHPSLMRTDTGWTTAWACLAAMLDGREIPGDWEELGSPRGRTGLEEAVYRHVLGAHRRTGAMADLAALGGLERVRSFPVVRNPAPSAERAVPPSASRVEGPHPLRSWREFEDEDEVLRAQLIIHLCEQPGGDAQFRFDARLTYRRTDPYAVEAVFKLPGHDDGVTWVLARELLWDGLRGTAGGGDVQVWSEGPTQPTEPGRRRTYLRLTSPDGTALLFMRTDHVVEFLDQSQRMVALGAEPEQLAGKLADLEQHLHELTASPGCKD